MSKNWVETVKGLGLIMLQLLFPFDRCYACKINALNNLRNVKANNYCPSKETIIGRIWIIFCFTHPAQLTKVFKKQDNSR